MTRGHKVGPFLLSGAIALGTILALPVETGCGIIVMCPANYGSKRALDREFFTKASKCENGDDPSCTAIDDDAKKKVQMCKDCSGCDGTEKYEDVAKDAKAKNRCNHHSEAAACLAIASELDAQAKAKGVYSDDAIVYFQKACKYGDQPSCDREKQLSQSEGNARAVALQRNQCVQGCYALAHVVDGCPSCMSIGSMAPQRCIDGCQQIGLCMQSCK